MHPVDADGDGVFDSGQRFVYDGDDVVLVFDDTGSLTNRLLHGPAVDQVFADENALGEILWGLTDNQGSVRDVAQYDAATNTTSVVNHIKYDSFGNITAESDPSVDFLYSYTGRVFDADAGLFYYRARWYDASVGKFISEDPLGFAGGDTNLSRYVGNSPINYTDPSGLAALPNGQRLRVSDITRVTDAYNRYLQANFAALASRMHYSFSVGDISRVTDAYNRYLRANFAVLTSQMNRSVPVGGVPRVGFWQGIGQGFHRFTRDAGLIVQHPIDAYVGFHLGGLQGGLNTRNGLQDSLIGILNLPALLINSEAWVAEQAGALDPRDPLRVPYIPSPDWSRGKITRESGHT